MTREERQRSYKQVARAKAQERTRETLLQAAAEEVERDGWKQASLESVAARAGVTKQTALRHFGSKEGLLDAVIRRTSSIMVKERNETPIGDIHGAISNLMRHYERYGDMVVRMLPYRDAVVRVMGNDRRNSLVRAVDRGHEVHEDWVLRTFEPQLSDLNPRARERRLAQLVAICDVYVWKILRRDIGLEMPLVEEAVVEMIERLVTSEAPIDTLPEQSKRKGASPTSRKPRATQASGRPRKSERG
jgi:AcrR family transcriptional regulator